MSEQPEHSSEPAGERTGRHEGRATAATVAAVALASGSTVKVAARKAGISVRCLANWRRKPAFERLVNRYRDQLVDEAVGQVSKDLSAATAVLRKLLKSRQEQVQLRAAAELLALGIALRKHADTDRRLAEVE